MYYYAGQFQNLKGRPWIEQVRIRWCFYHVHKVVPRLYALVTVISLGFTVMLTGLAYEFGLLAQGQVVADLALIGSLLGGLSLYTLLYLIVLNKVEYPKYIIFINERR